VPVSVEPSCLLELPRRSPGDGERRSARKLRQAFTFEEFWRAKPKRAANLRSRIADRALVHGHCHQKAFDVSARSSRAEAHSRSHGRAHRIESCCGMAGAFGYGADTIDVSKAMGELSAAARRAQSGADTIDRCRRHLVPPSDPRTGTGRDAIHVARGLAMSLQ
jgi:Fe-S oxidoreductase